MLGSGMWRPQVRCHDPVLWWDRAFCAIVYTHTCRGTAGSPSANGAIDAGSSGDTFADMFAGCLAKSSVDMPALSAADWTFMFELTSRRNRVVVRYDTTELTLLAARHRRTGEELTPEAARRLACQSYNVRPCERSAELCVCVCVCVCEGGSSVARTGVCGWCARGEAKSGAMRQR